MKKKLLILPFFITIFLLLFQLPAQAQSKREKWIQCVTSWCNIMEADGNWKYYSGKGEITDYLKNRSTQRYSNCALMVSHALQYMGVLQQNQKIYAKSSANDIRTVYSGSGTEAAIRSNCSVISIQGTLTVSQLISRGSLLKGDIVCFYGMQHTAVYMGTTGNNSYWLDAGRSGTSTAKEAGIWNKTYSLTRIRDARYLTSASWKVNDIIRFPDQETTSAAASSLSKSSATKNTVSKTTTVSSKTVPLVKANVHRLPSVTGISYKLKRNHVYLSFTVKNNCPSKEKITISYFLGTKTNLGSGKSKKTVTLQSGKKKTFKNVCVSLNSVNKTRCYLTLKMKCHQKSSLVNRYKVILPTVYQTAKAK